MTHKNRESFMFGSAGCSLLSTEGFSCSVDVLNGGLEISKLQIFRAVNFSKILVTRPLGLNPDLHFNKFGSETLSKNLIRIYE
jgi:hypothetical protein